MIQAEDNATSANTNQGDDNDRNDTLDAMKRKRYEDYLVTVCCVFNFFADSIELITPGVITQSVSCELELSTTHETILTVSFYVSMLVSSIITNVIADMIARRTLILLSTYAAVIVTVLCAIVPNFTTLLLSRILLGTSAAVNYIIVSVYATEMIHDRKRYVTAMSLCATALSAAGVWIGILSYVMLERVGWRIFILLTSLPFFCPQLVLLQFFLPDSRDRLPASQELAVEGGEASLLRHEEKQHTWHVYALITKLGILYLIQCLVGYGAIILMPAFTKAHNLANNEGSPCGRLHGSQFIFFTITFGVFHALGRLVSYLLQDRINPLTQNFFSYLIGLIASCIMVAYPHSLTLLITCEGFVQLYNAHHGSVMFILSHSLEFIGQKHIALSSSLVYIGSYIGFVIGTFLSATIDFTIVLKLNVVMAILNFPMLFWMHKGSIKII